MVCAIWPIENSATIATTSATPAPRMNSARMSLSPFLGRIIPSTPMAIHAAMAATTR